MSDSIIHPKLAHLTPEHVINLINEYYAKNPVSDLIRRFNVDCLPVQLYTLFPPDLSSERCPNCGAMMVLPRISRNAIRNEYKFGLRCLHCKHRAKGSCVCSYCKEINKNNVLRLSVKLPKMGRKNYQIPHGPFKVADLTLKQTVSLLSLLRCYGSAETPNGLSLSPSKKSSARLAPSGDFTEEILTNLIDAGLLQIYEQSNSKNFSFLANQLAISSAAQWHLPKTVSSELINDIEARITHGNWPVRWYEQLLALVFDLAFAECKEFYVFCASERRFPNENEHGIDALIRNLLEDFSVGQCFRIIHSGAQYAADFLVKQSATERQAAKYMIGACERWADKARAQNWVVNAFRRNLNCPRSMVSYVLYDFILKASDEGLNTPVALIRLPNNIKGL